MNSGYVNASSATGLWPAPLRSVLYGLGIPNTAYIPTCTGDVPVGVWKTVSSGNTHCGRLTIRNYVWAQMGEDYSKQHINNLVRRCQDFIVPGLIPKTQQTSLDARLEEFRLERQNGKAVSRRNLRNQKPTDVSSGFV